MTCATCKWWVQTGEEHEGSTRCCTRYPPVLLGDSGYEGMFNGVWPETARQCVACGEYTAAEDEGKESE